MKVSDALKWVFHTAMAISCELTSLLLPISTNYNRGKHLHSWFFTSYYSYILENETYSSLQVNVFQHDYLRNNLPGKFESILEGLATGAPKLINSDLFLEKRATVPIKTQGVQRSSSGKMSTF